MPLIVRIDVDRPYGKRPATRHILSRLSSDLYFPRVPAFGYLRELKTLLRLLNERRAKSYVFFRLCTLPCKDVMALLEEGGHEPGLHLEDSRSYATFKRERERLERHLGRKVRSFSKHGSGGARFGRRHYAPYEAEKYIQWGRRGRMAAFFGNLEDPSIRATKRSGLLTYPSAFWLEPAWRDTRRFTVDWLLRAARRADIVLLVHPDNLLASSILTDQFDYVVTRLGTKILPGD